MGGKDLNNSVANTKLLPVLTVLQWLSAFGGVKDDQEVNIAITKVTEHSTI